MLSSELSLPDSSLPVCKEEPNEDNVLNTASAAVGGWELHGYPNKNCFCKLRLIVACFRGRGRWVQHDLSGLRGQTLTLLFSAQQVSTSTQFNFRTGGRDSAWKHRTPGIGNFPMHRFKTRADNRTDLALSLLTFCSKTPAKRPREFPTRFWKTAACDDSAAQWETLSEQARSY